jgi:hypothetical protein
MYVAAVFANGLRATAAATMVVDQFNGFSAETRAQVAVWLIGNEIAPDDPFTAQTLAVIKAKAQPPLDTLPICVPLQMSSTADALAKVRQSHAQFAAAGLADRFIACFNFYGLGQARAHILTVPAHARVPHRLQHPCASQRARNSADVYCLGSTGRRNTAMLN